MDVVCEGCGVANREGTEFCLFCGTYLAWDRTATRPVVDRADEAASARTEPVATPVPVEPRPPSEPVPEAPVAAAPAVQRDAGAARVAFAPAPGRVCPVCGRDNDAARRFCAKCGETLAAVPGAGGVATGRPGAGGAGRTSAWTRISQNRDRAARLAYRRSLPPLYRWRRVGVSVLALVLVGGGLTVAGRHPVRWGVERWYDLQQATVPVTGIQATTDPADASAAGTDPASLLDGTEQAWTMGWAPQAEGSSCGGAPGTAVVVLRLAPTRIREIDIAAGLPEANADRPLQFRPQAIGVRFDGGPCRRFTLENRADLQRLKLDSAVAVTEVRVGVDTAVPAREDGGRRLLSIAEIGLRARPS